jgi:ubiquinol-cytochrome c reductase cytochrome b subunit
MDDGGTMGNGLRIATNSFTFEDVTFLTSILTNRYALKVSVYKVKNKDQWTIYIHRSSLPKLASIIGPYLHPSMVYKLNGAT